MENNFTKEKTQESVEKITNKVRQEVTQDFNRAQIRVWIAEKKLLNSLNEEQRKLYNEFYKQRELFYDIANELYVKRF